MGPFVGAIDTLSSPLVLKDRPTSVPFNFGYRIGFPVSEWVAGRTNKYLQSSNIIEGYKLPRFACLPPECLGSLSLRVH